MTDPQQLIEKYYFREPELMQILLRHSRDVAESAIAIARRHPRWRLDLQFVHEAAMLHDIGIIHTDAPGICCHGVHPYLAHGILGGNLLRYEGLVRHARVAERHTGTGLTTIQIKKQGLPLPPVDLVPLSLEEQLVCYADKFYSKSRLDQVKTAEQVEQSLAKFGADSVSIFKHWREMFE